MSDVLKDTSAEAMADGCERNLHALLRTALRDGRDMGYAVGILQSSEMGYSVYERMGFKSVRKIGNWYLKLEV